MDVLQKHMGVTHDCYSSPINLGACSERFPNFCSSFGPSSTTTILG